MTEYPPTYCPDCGIELDVSGAPRCCCPSCERPVYHQPSIAASVAVVDPWELAVFGTRLSSGPERNYAVVHFAVRREDATDEAEQGEEAADVAFLTPEEYDECEALVHDRGTVEAAIAEF